MSLPDVATEKQRRAFQYALANPYCILAMDPRLGKTLTSLAVARHLKQPALVICPAYLVANWKREISKWYPKAKVLVPSPKTKAKDLLGYQFAIVSYDKARKCEWLFEWPSIVICDEVHNLKNQAAKRTQAIHKGVFENSIKRFIGLTGTPLKNRVREFYSLIALTYYNPQLKDPKFLSLFPDEITFAEHFSYRQQFDVFVTSKRGARFRMPVVKYEGLRNTKELKTWLKGRYIRMKANASDLPPIVEREVLVKDTPNPLLLGAFKAFFSDEGNRSVRPDIKVQAALQKVPFTIKYVENLLEEVETPVLVYSDHRAPIEQIAEHFGVAPITGKVPPKKRAAMVASFQAGEGRILCATIGALKEGQDLFRAHDIVLSDLCWVSGDLKQVINRIRAMGEKIPRSVHYIFGSPQDEMIRKALLEKQKVIDEAT